MIVIATALVSLLFGAIACSFLNILSEHNTSQCKLDKQELSIALHSTNGTAALSIKGDQASVQHGGVAWVYIQDSGGKNTILNLLAESVPSGSPLIKISDYMDSLPEGIDGYGSFVLAVSVDDSADMSEQSAHFQSIVQVYQTSQNLLGNLILSSKSLAIIVGKIESKKSSPTVLLPSLFLNSVCPNVLGNLFTWNLGLVKSFGLGPTTNTVAFKSFTCDSMASLQLIGHDASDLRLSIEKYDQAKVLIIRSNENLVYPMPSNALQQSFNNHHASVKVQSNDRVFIFLPTNEKASIDLSEIYAFSSAIVNISKDVLSDEQKAFYSVRTAFKNSDDLFIFTCTVVSERPKITGQSSSQVFAWPTMENLKRPNDDFEPSHISKKSKIGTFQQKSVEEKATALLEASEGFFKRLFKNFVNLAIPMDNRIGIVYKNNPFALVEAADSTCILMHADVHMLISKYCQTINQNVDDYIRSLIVKRPLAKRDKFVAARIDINGNPITCPTFHEWSKRSNGNYISFSDVFFSSLLLVHSRTRFINDGGKYNLGQVDSSGKFIEDGCVTSVVPPRFNITFKMDNKYGIIYPSTKLLIEEGSIESILYDYYFDDQHRWMSYSEIVGMSKAEITERYAKTPNGKGFFDKFSYGKRMQLSFIPFIMNANLVAKKANRMAYLFITGWGLGEWKGAQNQGDLFILECFKVLSSLQQAGQLSHISDVNFSYIENNVFHDAQKLFKQTYPASTINFLNTKHNPASLENFNYPNDTRMLFYSFGANGNAYPGDQYWLGGLNTSESSAAACTTIADLHNPEVNPEFLNRIYQFKNDMIEVPVTAEIIANEAVTDDFFANLSEDLTADNYLQLSERFFANYEKNYKAVEMHENNRIKNVYAGRFSELVASMEQTRVSMHHDTMKMIEAYCQSKNLIVEEFIKRLIRDCPLYFYTKAVSDSTRMEVSLKGQRNFKNGKLTQMEII